MTDKLITEARELCERATPGTSFAQKVVEINRIISDVKSESEKLARTKQCYTCALGKQDETGTYCENAADDYDCEDEGCSNFVDGSLSYAKIAEDDLQTVLDVIPELCDALEKAEAEIEKMKPFYTIADDTFRHWENAAYAMRDDERKKHRWIPVTERLPEIDVAVLVLHTYQRDEYSPITIGRLYQPCDKCRNPYWTFVSIQASDGAVYNDGTDFICPGSEYVTHWRPLPAPPEEEGE